MLKEIVYENRSRRRFYQDHVINIETMKELVDLARMSPTGRNAQNFKFIISCDPVKNASIFPHIGWAGMLPDWPGPEEGERPSAYIIILDDTELGKSFGPDLGIAAQTILLGAVEKGLGGCMIMEIKKEALAGSLEIAPRYHILMVIALGKPKEKVVVETIGQSGDTKYWRDSDGTHHIPKRTLESILLG